jgi:hypothetical protein
MSSIIWRGHNYHGISITGRGVFTDDKYRFTYAGQCKDGYACGLAVLTWSGYTTYAELGPDGQYDGRRLQRDADGHNLYRLSERGKAKESAVVYADGSCEYNGVACTPDDPHLLALVAQVAPVEVRPAAPAPHPPIAYHWPPSNRPMDRPARFAPAGAGGRRGHRGEPPTPHAVAGGCAAQPNSSRAASHGHAATCA